MTALPIPDLEDMYDDRSELDLSPDRLAELDARVARMLKNPELGYSVEEAREILRNWSGR
jgi:hypothetical protein